MKLSYHSDGSKSGLNAQLVLLFDFSNNARNMKALKGPLQAIHPRLPEFSGQVTLLHILQELFSGLGFAK